MSSNTITVRILAERSPYPACAVCGSSQWLNPRHAPKKAAAPILNPCTWVDQEGINVYAHAVEILLAVIFNNTIEGQQISQDFYRVPVGENDRKRLALRLIKNLSDSSSGKERQVRERIRLLRDRLITKSNYDALNESAGQDIVQAYSWMRGPAPLIQEQDERKESAVSDVDSDSYPPTDDDFLVFGPILENPNLIHQSSQT